MAIRHSIRSQFMLRPGRFAALAVFGAMASLLAHGPIHAAKPGSLSAAGKSAAPKDACQAGRSLYAGGDVIKAIASLERCVEKEARNREAWSTLATARLEAGRFSESADAFAKAHALRPGDATFLTGYLDALDGAGRAEERIPVLRALTEARKDDLGPAEKLLALTDSLGAVRYADDWLFALEKLGQGPDAAIHHQEKLAAAYLARGLREKGQAEYRGLLSRRPENGEYWAGLAASIAPEDRQAAVECYRKAILYTRDAGMKSSYEKLSASLMAPPGPPTVVAAVPAPAPAPVAATAPKAPTPVAAAPAKPFDAKAYQDSVYKVELEKRMAAIRKPAPSTPAPAVPVPQISPPSESEKETAKKAEAEQKQKEKLAREEKEKQDKLAREAKESQDKAAKAESDKKAREEKEKQDKLAKDTEKKAKEDRERLVKDSLAKVEQERVAKAESDKKAREEKEKQDKLAREAKESQDKAAKAEKDRLEKLAKDAEKKAKEDRERLVKDSLAKVEVERLARLDAEKKAKEEKEKTERLGKEEKDKQERLVREARELVAKKAKEERERFVKDSLAKDMRERFVRDSLAKVESERLARMEAEKKARERQERRDRAIVFYRGGQLDSADALFKVVLAETPDGEVHYFAGRTQMDKGRGAKALDLLHKAPKDKPDLDLYLGRAYKSVGKDKEALEAYERHFAKSQDAATLEIICALRKPAADPGPWAACVEKLLEKKPASARAHEELAVHYRKRGDKEKALGHYAKVMALEPSHAEANYHLGMDWSSSGVHDRAVPPLEKAAAAFPARSEVWKALAKGQAATGRKAEAWESYKKAAGLLPKDPEVAKGRLSLAREPGREADLDAAYLAFLKIVPEDAEANLGYARIRFAAKDYPAAERHFRIGCKDSKDASAWGNYGRSLLEVKKLDEAALALQKALDLGETSMALRLDLARLRLDKGEADKAEALVKEISSKAPSDPEPYFWLGKIAEKRQQVTVQEEFYRKANQLRPDEPKYAEALGKLYLDRDEFKQGISILSPVEPRLSIQGRMLLADCLASGGDGTRALAIYSELFRKEPGPLLLSRRIDALVRMGKAGEAAEAARGSAFVEKPEVQFSLAKAHLALSESHVLKGDLDLAVSLLKDALDADGHRPEYHYYLGKAWHRKGKHGRAMDSYTDALRYRVEYPEAVYGKGLCLVETGKALDARNFFGELSQHADLRWKARGLMGLARVFEAEGKWEAVEHHLVRSVGTLPTSEAMAYLSRVHLKLGRFPEAEEWARRALEGDKENVEGNVALAEALAARKKVPEALGLAEAALRLKPLSCDLLVQTAKLNLESGRVDSTLMTTGKAIQACPSEPMPHFYAGMASRVANRPEDAKRHFKSFRKLGGDKKMLPE